MSVPVAASDWATVAAAAIGGIVGLVGGLVGARWQMTHQRKQQWRKWQQEAAAELAGRLGGSLNGVKNAIDRRREKHPEALNAAAFAKVLVNETSLPLARVELLLGTDTDTHKNARGAVDALFQAVACLENGNADGAESFRQSAEADATAFFAAARESLRRGRTPG